MNLETIITDLRSALPGPKSNTLSPEKLRAMADYLEAMIPAAPSKREMDVLARVDALWHDDVRGCLVLCEFFGAGSSVLPRRPEIAELARNTFRALREDDKEALYQSLHAQAELAFTIQARDEFADEDVL